MIAPTISNDEIVFTGIVTIDSLTISGAVPNDNNTVVNFVSGITAVQKLLRHNSRVVRAHHSRGSDTCTDGLFLKHDSEIIVGSAIVFTVTYVTEGSVF